MKVHVLDCRVYEGFMDWCHDGGSYQQRIYIEGKGVLGFHGGGVGSFSSTKESIAEAENMVNGRAKDAKYLGAIEVDDTLAEQLVAAGVNSQSAESVFRKTAYDFLIATGLVKPEPAEEVFVVNPKTLTPEKKQRLEAIVCQFADVRARNRILGLLGNAGPARKLEIEEINRASEMDSSYFPFESSDVLSDEYLLERAERLGLDEGVKTKLTRRSYRQAIKKRDYGKALELSDKLDIPEKEVSSLREKRLKAVAIGGAYELYQFGEDDVNSYISEVRKAAEAIPEERVGEVISEVYDYLMGNKDIHIEKRNIFERVRDFAGKLTEKFWGCQYAGYTDYLHAGQLAKEFNLGREKVLESGRKFIESGSFRSYEEAERASREFELPEELLHPVMLKLYEMSLYGNLAQARIIAEKHGLTLAEQTAGISRAYVQAMGSGWFENALALREMYGAAIHDTTVDLDDLRDLVGVLNYHGRGEGSAEEVISTSLD